MGTCLHLEFVYLVEPNGQVRNLNSQLSHAMKAGTYTCDSILVVWFNGSSYDLYGLWCIGLLL